MNLRDAKRIRRQKNYLDALLKTRRHDRACEAAGIDYSLVAHWRRRHPEFVLDEQAVIKQIAEGK